MAPDHFRWHLGEIMVQKGWITWDQLNEAIRIQRQANQDFHHLTDTAPHGLKKKEGAHLFLGEVLLMHNLIRWDQLQMALEVQKETKSMLGEILLNAGAISQKDLYRGIAFQTSMSFVDLDRVTISPEVFSLVPKNVILELKFLPLVRKGKDLLIAVSNPSDLHPERELQKLMPEIIIHASLASPDDIEKAITRYYGR